MSRFRLSHILLWGLIASQSAIPLATAQNSNTPRQNLPTIYQDWLNEDARYLITDQERSEFEKLATNEQRDKFITDFWERRDPDPGSGKNTLKTEHYRRLAYVNQHFAANIAGYRTDRGRIYIIYGPPVEIEKHFSDAGSMKASDLVGGGAIPYDWERWRYTYIVGIGKDVILDFVDKCAGGRFELMLKKTDLNKYKPKK